MVRASRSLFWGKSMTRLASRSALAALAFAAVLLPAESRAGSTRVYGTYCTKNSDGSGYCNGSYAGVRAATDPNAYVYFGWSGSTYQVFGEYLNGVSYSCIAPSSLATAFQVAMSVRGEYFVNWN